MPALLGLGIFMQMDGICLIPAIGHPGFICGKAQDRGNPANQAFQGFIHHGAASAAFNRGRAIAIERVFANIKVKG